MITNKPVATAHGFTNSKPSAYDQFEADQSPVNAVRLAIADHRHGMTDWAFLDSLTKARDICLAHTALLASHAELTKALGSMLHHWTWVSNNERYEPYGVPSGNTLDNARAVHYRAQELAK